MAITCVLFLAAIVSADYEIKKVEIDGIILDPDFDPDFDPEFDEGGVSVTAGETVEIDVWFIAEEYDYDVTVRVELEGDKKDTSAETSPFDVRPGREYHKTLHLKVPYELKDELYDELTLNIEIDGADTNTEKDYYLEVERPTYNADIKSISVPQTISAGDVFPVEIVLKNIGYNDLDDVYVTVSLPALGIEKSGYFGDIVALECDEDDEDDEFPWRDYYEDEGDNKGLDRDCNEDDPDSISGKLYLEVPFEAQAGLYALEVQVSNDDATSSAAKEIVIENDFENTVFVSGSDLWIVNPTNDLVGYRVVPESPASVSEGIVMISAGSSKTVTVSPNADGEYSFNVNIFTMNGELVKTVAFTGEADESVTSNPVVVLTVILAIIFIVLLIVLIVLIGKKPERSEEFGESYY